MPPMKQSEPAGPVPTAGELRRQLAEKQLAQMERDKQAQQREHEKHTAFIDDFMKGHINDTERAKMRKLVMDAVAQGQMEVLVYTFPSSLCTDDGRAINSGEGDWPKTLQGKARELYDRFATMMKPQGYKLKAQIISFPGGMPGDVGFFLGWGD